MAETNVQIEVPRTGQKIRNLSVTAVQSDGSVATVLMQVVLLADADGNVIDLSALDALPDLLLVTQEVRGLLKLLVEGLTRTTLSGVRLDNL